MPISLSEALCAAVSWSSICRCVPFVGVFQVLDFSPFSLHGTNFVFYDSDMGRLRHFLALAAVTAAVSATFPAKAADPPKSEREKLIELQRIHQQKTLADDTPLPQTRMSQILQLRIENRQLVVNTPLKAPIVKQRADVPELGMPAELSYTESVAGDPESGQFEFTLVDYPDKLTSVRIHLLCQPNVGKADISMDSSIQSGPNGEHFARAMYTQTATRVTLQAFGTANDEDQDSQTVTLIEKDFASLREKHGAILETWLRPVFHKLQQDVVFATDSNAAWEALADDWPINSAAAARVEQLLPDLNSPKWPTRNAAVKELAKLGRDGATVVMHRGRNGLSLEQNVRLDEMLSRFRPLPTERAKTLSMNVDFLLDCEYSDDVTVRRLAAARLTKILGRSFNFPVDAGQAEREEAISRLRAGLRGEQKGGVGH
jgi:hypothetical protein